MKIWREERGDMLADQLAGVALLALVLAAVMTIHQGVLDTYVTGSNQTEVQQNARVGLQRIARDLRQTSGALTAATASSLTLLDRDTGAAVIYGLTGNAPNAILTRTTAGVASAVIGRVQVLAFVYRDVNNNVLAAPVGIPANVFRVDITIRTASEGTVVAGGIADTMTQLTTSARLRNL